MDKNLRIYSDKAVDDYYRAQSDLFPSEAYLVERHFPDHGRILDVGHEDPHCSHGVQHGPVAVRAVRFPAGALVPGDGVRGCD